MTDRFYCTTPIYYVNAPPHMGTGYTTIIADALTRFHAMTGKKTRMVTGSDEHSQGIADKAAEAGVTPLQFCDRLIPEFTKAWELLQIGDYGFYRTSSPEHRLTVQTVFQRIFDQGDVYKADYSGWYHTTDNCFVDEADLPEDPESDPRLKFLTEEAYWFRLSKYQDFLLEYHQAHPEAIVPDFRRNEMMNRIKEGLRDLCISRSSTDWGVPIPWDKDHVFYVWADALFTYMTGSGFDVKKAVENLEKGQDPLKDQPEDNFWPCDLHIMAKDIPWFHTVIWPAMLQSAGLPLPKQCLVHGYWNFDGTKMSKSKGNVFHPVDAVALVGADGVRYFVLKEVRVGWDGNFSVKGLAERYNYDLANDFGNLANRLLTMGGRFLKRRIPDTTEFHEAEEELLEIRAEAIHSALHHFPRVEFKEGLEAVWEVVRALNRAIDERKPWEMNKDPERRGELEGFFRASFECFRTILMLLAPVMPGAADALWEQCGLPGKATESDLNSAQERHRGEFLINKPQILFPKLDLADLEAEFVKRKSEMTGETMEATEKKAEAPQSTETASSTIQYDDFTKVKMITAKVLKAEAVEGADKLLRLTLDDGNRQDRTVVSGIRKFYSPEDMNGRMICIVDNLKPRKIFGILSEGMILAAGGDNGQPIVLVTPIAELPPGTRVG